MDKQWLEKTTNETIKVRLDYPAGYEPNVIPEAWTENVGQLVNLIAQAAEEEKQAALEEAGVGWHKADDFRLAKMALMASALYHIKIGWWDKHYPSDVFVGGPDSDDGVNELVAIRDMINEALSAAPKVLDHIKAKRTTNISGDTLLAFPWHEDGVRVVQVYDAALEQYGDGWVEVFVCSVKAGCQPGSEQEE